MQTTIDLSIIIVNYNTGNLLKQCIESIKDNASNISYEIIVIDNNSSDNSVDLIEKLENSKIIMNRINKGFAQANNQGIKIAQGKYIMLLNPDTKLLNSPLGKLIMFMEQHLDVGAVGPMVLNPDGRIQLACRRSFPTPWVSFCRLTGLSFVFPKSKIFGKYNLTYQNPNLIQEVDALSGAAMLVRRKVIEEVGLLDENFFMFGEDIDWCYRIKNLGWKICYIPEARIIHYKGESSKHNKYESIKAFYQSMIIFHKKHFAMNYFPVFNWIVYLGISLKKRFTLLRVRIFDLI